MSRIKTNLPKVRVSDPQLQQYLDSLSTAIRTWNGETNNSLDVVVTYRDFVEDTSLALALQQAQATSGITTGGGTGDTSLPPALSSLTATAKMGVTELSWAGTGVGNYGYTLVYRHTADVVASASVIGTTISGRFTDSSGETNATYYYWVRPVSQNNVVGTFNATAGTVQTTNKVKLADLDTDVPQMTSFVSAEQTISNAGSLAPAHGLAATPYDLDFYIICKTTEHGYAVDDMVAVTPASGFTVVPDATSINIRFAALANPLTGLHYTTGAAVTFTNANWKLVAMARV